MLFQIGSLKNFANVTGKHLCWGLFLIKLQAKAYLMLDITTDHYALRFADSAQILLLRHQVDIRSKAATGGVL